eukprot:scaffold2.g6867.t1
MASDQGIPAYADDALALPRATRWRMKLVADGEEDWEDHAFHLAELIRKARARMAPHAGSPLDEAEMAARLAELAAHAFHPAAEADAYYDDCEGSAAAAAMALEATRAAAPRVCAALEAAWGYAGEAPAPLLPSGVAAAGKLGAPVRMVDSAAELVV